MKKVLVLFLSILLSSCVANTQTIPAKNKNLIKVQKEQPPIKYNYVKWRELNTSSLFRARAKGLPIVVFISEKTCSACRKMEVETLTEESIVNKLNTNFIPTKLDIYDNIDMAETLLDGKNTIPAFAFLAPSGNLMVTTHGFYNEEMFNKVLDIVDNALDDSQIINLFKIL